MTMPHERTRALVWVGGFLIELARYKRLPLDVRQKAVVVARHFPTISQLSMMSLIRHSSGLGMGLEDPSACEWSAEDCKFGPLTESTRLAWPEDDQNA